MEEGREIVNGYPSTEGEIAPKKEISEEELGNLISALGNHEVKTLAFAAMRPGISYTRRASEGITLAQELRQHLQGKRTAWTIDPSNLFNYCKNSFSHPLTIATKQAVDRDLAIYGYKITDYGIEFGQALTGHLLDWSLKYDKSLIEVFGSTSSGARSKEIEVGEETVEFKKRAPTTRLKIFWGLLTSPSLPIREADLINTLGEAHNLIEQHIDNLARLGIISYQAREADQSYALYQLAEQKSGQEPQSFRSGNSTYPTLTRQIYSLFISDPNLEASPTEVYQRLVEIDPAYQGGKQSNMENRINKILSHLQRWGYLKYARFRKGIQSEISLTEDQRIMLYELLEILDRFQSGDETFWREGRKKAQDILADPEKMAILMLKAKQASPWSARTPQKGLEEQLFNLASKYPGSSTKQLQVYLEKEYGKRLQMGTLLKFLRQGVRLVPQKKRTAIYWTVNGNPD